jgi:hypothetical protein
MGTDHRDPLVETPADSTATPTGNGPTDCARRLGRGPAPAHPERFAVLLNCIDGRTQRPLIEWVRRELGVEHVDIVTEPGVDGVLASGDTAALDALLHKACVSRLAHGATTLVIAGHHDCAANPGDASSHARDLLLAADAVQRALPELPVRSVYVDASWSVDELPAARQDQHA